MNWKDKELERYEKILDELARNKCKTTFPNKDHRHAYIAIKKILEYSQKSFILLDKDLKGDIISDKESEEFIKEIKDAIERDVKVRLIVREIDESQNLFRKFVNLDENNEHFSFELMNPDSIDNLFLDGINFAIGDNEKVRLEFEGERNRTAQATVSFNDPTMVDELLSTLNICDCNSINEETDNGTLIRV